MNYRDEFTRLSLALDQLAKLAPATQSPWFQAASEAATNLAAIQDIAIADPTGGIVQDAESRTAIIAMLDLRTP